MECLGAHVHFRAREKRREEKRGKRRAERRDEKGREREREIIRSMTHHKGEKVEASLTELPVNKNGEEI